MSNDEINIAEQLKLLQERMNNLEDNQCYEILLDKINNIENNSQIHKDKVEYYRDKCRLLERQNEELKLLIGQYKCFVSQILKNDLCSQMDDAEHSI